MSIEVEHPNTNANAHPPSKRQHIAWRRGRVAELSAQGRTEREVSSILKVSLGTVSNDVSYLNKQARDNLQFHIQKRLPAQLAKCQNGLDQVLKLAWNTVLLDTGNGNHNHTLRLQALSLISDCYRHQMDLSTNAGIIEEAIRFTSSKTELLNKMHKQVDEKTETTEEANEKTTNTVF